MEHDMLAVICSLWVVGAVMPTLQRQKTDLYCDVIKTSCIMTGGICGFSRSATRSWWWLGNYDLPLLSACRPLAVHHMWSVSAHYTCQMLL